MFDGGKGRMAGTLWTESKLEACMSLFALTSPPITAFLGTRAKVRWTLSYETCKHLQEPCCPLLCLPPFLCLPRLSPRRLLSTQYCMQVLSHHEPPVQLNEQLIHINRILVVTSHGGGSGILPLDRGLKKNFSFILPSHVSSI